MGQYDYLKHTRVYQEALEEGELKMVPLLLQAGLSVEQISAQSGLELEAVTKAAAVNDNRPNGAGRRSLT